MRGWLMNKCHVGVVVAKNNGNKQPKVARKRKVEQ